jgi:hypothetical protein
MQFTMGQRVITTVNAESMWPGGLNLPAGSIGTISGTPVMLGSTIYSVLMDAEPENLPASYDASELYPA